MKTKKELSAHSRMIRWNAVRDETDELLESINAMSSILGLPSASRRGQSKVALWERFESLISQPAVQTAISDYCKVQVALGDGSK